MPADSPAKSHRVAILLLILAIVGSVIYARMTGPAGASGPLNARTSSPAGAPTMFTMGADTNLGWSTTVSAAHATLAELRTGGIHQVRQDFRWDLIQPVSPSAYSWERTDAIMAAASVSRANVLPILDYSPKWSNGGAGATTAPFNNADFARFAGAVVRRYGPGGTFWADHPKLTADPLSTVEVWNEPWCTRSWAKPDPHAYANLVRQTARAVRAVAPLTKVAVSMDAMNIGGGPYANTSKWDVALLAAFPDITTYASVASVHLYSADKLAPNLADLGAIPRISADMAAASVHLPIWITETGSDAAAISATLPGAASRTITPQARTLQATYMATTLTYLSQLPASTDLRRVYVFSAAREAFTDATVQSTPLDGYFLTTPSGAPQPALKVAYSWASPSS